MIISIHDHQVDNHPPDSKAQVLDSQNEAEEKDVTLEAFAVDPYVAVGRNHLAETAEEMPSSLAGDSSFVTSAVVEAATGPGSSEGEGEELEAFQELKNTASEDKLGGMRTVEKSSYSEA